MRRRLQRARGRSRILAVLLLACLLVFSLAGCQADQTARTDNGSLQAVTEAETTEPGNSEIGSGAETADPGDSDLAIPADGSYTSKEDVALYLHTYGCLPDHFISKKEAQKLGWSGGSLEPYAPGKCIGGDRFGNYEGVLPQGIVYHECDIDTLGADKRGAKRIVYGEDGSIYYTDDHYQSFTQLY